MHAALRHRHRPATHRLHQFGRPALHLAVLPGASRPPWAPERAEREPGQDRRATYELRDASRVAEQHYTGGSTDERLEVHEGTGNLGWHARLAVGEQRERRQRAS